MNGRSFFASSACFLAVPALAGTRIRIRNLYRRDLDFSDLAPSFEGQRIEIWGYMSPPLKADIDFFALTKKPLSVCPFCETEAEWPDDILAVYTRRRMKTPPFNQKLLTGGMLKLDTAKDESTGFVGRARLTDTVYGRF